MPRLTIHDQLARGLVRLGAVEQKKLTRYRVFTDPRYPASSGRMVYLGRIDAVRVGLQVGDSIPSDGLKARALSTGLPEKIDA